MSALRERVAAARQVREQALAVSGEATSGGGTIRVVVDSTGVMTALTLAPSVFDRGTPERLSSAIVATIQAAAAKARAGMAEAMAPIRDGGATASAATAAVPELAGLRFDVPEVPRTAIDPTVDRDPWQAEQPEPASPPPPPRPVEPAPDDEAEWPERPW